MNVKNVMEILYNIAFCKQFLCEWWAKKSIKIEHKLYQVKLTFCIFR